jgi:predicted transposase/invertase (TIGR01784 family)
MRRDTIFHKIFQQSPTLLFDLLPSAPANAASYTFASVEVKETAFRMDGVFRPPSADGLVYFCEVQFQPDEVLFERLFSEVGIFIYRYRETFFDWRAVIIYPSRSLEQSRSEVLSEMLDSRRIMRVYLDELGAIDDLPASLSLMVLTTFEGEAAIDGARGLIDRAGAGMDGRAIIDLVTTIMVYKFNSLTRDEVDAMLGIELTETRVYQDAKREGTIEEAKKLALKLLRRKYGSLGTGVIAKIDDLSLDRLESLCEDIMDFVSLQDLDNWLTANSGDLPKATLRERL